MSMTLSVSYFCTVKVPNVKQNVPGFSFQVFLHYWNHKNCHFQSRNCDSKIMPCPVLMKCWKLSFYWTKCASNTVILLVFIDSTFNPSDPASLPTVLSAHGFHWNGAPHMGAQHFHVLKNWTTHKPPRGPFLLSHNRRRRWKKTCIPIWCPEADAGRSPALKNIHILFPYYSFIHKHLNQWGTLNTPTCAIIFYHQYHQSDHKKHRLLLWTPTWTTFNFYYMYYMSTTSYFIFCSFIF